MLDVVEVAISNCGFTVAEQEPPSTPPPPL